LGEKINNTNSKYELVKKEDIFDANNELVNLGKVKKLQVIMPELNWFINNIQVGYEKQEYNYPLARQEFANMLEFINALKILGQKIDLISKYRADYIGIHLLRHNYVNVDKKDSKSDNDLFWVLAFKYLKNINVEAHAVGNVTNIYVSVGQSVVSGQELMRVSAGGGLIFEVFSKVDGQITSINVGLGQSIMPDTIVATINARVWQAVKGDRVTNITGLEGGGYFNIMLSPKANLMRHARYFASILDKHDKTLIYTSGTESMSALEYDDTELGHVVEKADLSVANAQPFFKPLIFEFDAVVGNDLSELLGDTPCGYFTFEHNNLILKGFPIEVTGSREKSEQTVKCIAHSDTPDNLQEYLHKRLPNKLYP
jgi:hypothetical protein